MSNAGIQIDGLAFGIGSFAIRDFSLAIPSGEYVVLSGPNGAGKSVLVKLICGLYRPTAGAIRICGTDVTELPPWQRPIGYVPQDGLLFPNRDVFGNLAFGLELRPGTREDRRTEVEKMAKFLGVSRLLHRMPVGLSGGERQKVSLGRALILQPKVLLLDEPVSAIDESGRDLLCRELRRIQQEIGITTLHISHNSQETALVADRVVKIANGQIVPNATERTET
jgi:ABC-type sugar transport system ATPase subunit